MTPGLFGTKVSLFCVLPPRGVVVTGCGPVDNSVTALPGRERNGLSRGLRLATGQACQERVGWGWRSMRSIQGKAHLEEETSKTEALGTQNNLFSLDPSPSRGGFPSKLLIPQVLAQVFLGCRVLKVGLVINILYSKSLA